MSINYYEVFRQKTGVDELSTPWSEDQIDVFLDQAAFLVSRNYATPWTSFSDASEKYKYGIALLATLEYWWKQLALSVTKFDIKVGTANSEASNKAGTMFDRVMKIISSLQQEIVELDIVEEGSGDIVVGDLIKRSKYSGYIVPRSDDPKGNWLS